MRSAPVFRIACAAVLLMASAVRADQTMTEDDLQAAMAQNQALDGYVARNGLPDVAEVHARPGQSPWEDHEVRAYYLDQRLELGFARAFILGRPEVQLIRYQRKMTNAQVAEIASRPRLRTASTGRAADAADRAEAAARRAQAAADRIEASAASVERAADRAEAVLARATAAMPEE